MDHVMTAGEVRAGTRWRDIDPDSRLMFDVISVQRYSAPEPGVKITWVRTDRLASNQVYRTSASTIWDYEEVIYVIEEELLP